MQKFTPPKSKQILGEAVVLPAAISADAEFKQAVDTFCEYAAQNGISFTNKDGGITVKKDPTLAKEGFCIHITEGGAEVSVADLKAAHGALSVLLCEIKKEDGGFGIAQTVIKEEPDMFYRGLSVDLARQWHGPEYILKYIDLCYMNRATHLQLHFTDDESFTLPIESFPKLCTENRTYTREDIKRITEYANTRGIILVPEVDIPGHTEQFCRKYPELFGTLSTEQNTGNAGFLFNILPADDEIFSALEKIFGEVVEMFPYSPLIHIGGDEAAVGCWEKCKRTQNYMKEHNIHNIKEMYAEFIRIVTDMILSMGRTPVVWEGFAKEYNDRISKDVVVIAWESYYQPAYDLAESGFKLINCSWKPLYIVTPDTHWTPDEILDWDPWSWQHFWEKSAAYPDGFSIDRSYDKVLGGQVCAWGDRLKNYEDWEKGAIEELELISERMPALCKRLIDLSYKK